jgi:hypothetical protein
MQHLLTTDDSATIDECAECAALCRELVNFCLGPDAPQPFDRGHVRLLLDCADLSRTCADMLGRGTDLHEEMCRLVVDVTRLAAQSCRHFASPESLLCAESCERTADACETLLVSRTWRDAPVSPPGRGAPRQPPEASVR